MRYYVKIFNERADEMIEARVDAKTPEEAIDMLMHQDKVKEIVEHKWGGEAEVECRPIEDAVLDKKRFILQPSKEPGWYVLTDEQLLITLRFRAGDFNGSQQVTMIDESRVKDPMDIATSLRLMGDWMLKYHKDLI